MELLDSGLVLKTPDTISGGRLWYCMNVATKSGRCLRQ